MATGFNSLFSQPVSSVTQKLSFSVQYIADVFLCNNFKVLIIAHQSFFLQLATGLSCFVGRTIHTLYQVDHYTAHPDSYALACYHGMHTTVFPLNHTKWLAMAATKQNVSKKSPNPAELVLLVSLPNAVNVHAVNVPPTFCVDFISEM